MLIIHKNVPFFLLYLNYFIFLMFLSQTIISLYDIGVQ